MSKNRDENTLKLLLVRLLAPAEAPQAVRVHEVVLLVLIGPHEKESEVSRWDGPTGGGWSRFGGSSHNRSANSMKGNDVMSLQRRS